MKLRALALALLLALFAVVGGVFAQDEEMGTIADVVVAQAAEGEFTTLLAAVSAADPAILEALSNPEAELTVFAPTDAAFAALPEFVLNYVLSHQDLLNSVLQYHVVEGKFMSTDVLTLVDENGMASIPTLQGASLTLNADLNAMVITLDQANIVLEMIDLEASNGVIHVIDAVLVPPVELPAVDAAFVSGDLVTAGSSTVGPLSEAIQEKFQAEGYTGQINNAIVGSGAGFERFCDAGETDIANASRPIKDSEVEACAALNPPRTPIELLVGVDLLSVVINPANDWATDITLEELAMLFGTAENWSDVRAEWPAEPIIRFAPGSDSGTYDFFNEVVFDEDEAPIQNATNISFNEDDTVLLEGVAGNTYAIGFFGYAYYINNTDRVTALSINGLAPNPDNATTYALARPLFLYTDAGIIAEKPQVGQFISYYLQNVDAVIDEVGYIRANPFNYNISKLIILALTDTGM